MGVCCCVNPNFQTSYGGWTEMIREGADHSGLWTCLKSGLKYV